MFRKGKITTMSPMDFRKLIGHVGRIEYNLYGNVIFVSSQDDKLPKSDYVGMLKEPVPEQFLSRDAGPKVLINPERKYIVNALKGGNIELVKRNKSQSEESYVMMLKFGLIILRDIMTNNNIVVKQSSSYLISEDDAGLIKNKFKNAIAFTGGDINISADQTRNWILVIKKWTLIFKDGKLGIFL